MREDLKIDENLGEYINEMLVFKSRPRRPRNKKVDLRRKEMQQKDYSAGWLGNASKQKFMILCQIILDEGEKTEKDSTDEELPIEESETATPPLFETVETHNEDEIVRHADLRER